MADFMKLCPLIFHFAAGVYGKNGQDLLLPYEEQFVLAKTSGWSDDADDPGGATMVDVTISTYSAYRRRRGILKTSKANLRNISFCEWTEILKTMYWDKWRADEIHSQGIANLLVDWVWSSGPKTISNTQRIIGVSADGIVGPKTIAAVNDEDCDRIFALIFERRVRYLHNCRGAWKYLRGWLRRLNAILPDGSFLINQRIIK